MSRPTDMYPDGYPPNHSKPCGDVNIMLGAMCIIDNAHVGRPHWGPGGKRTEDRRYYQWGISSSQSASSASSLSLAPGS